jgi:hypothetical protein
MGDDDDDDDDDVFVGPDLDEFCAVAMRYSCGLLLISSIVFAVVYTQAMAAIAKGKMAMQDDDYEPNHQ